MASLSIELQMIDPLCFEIIAKGQWQGKKI